MWRPVAFERDRRDFNEMLECFFYFVCLLLFFALRELFCFFFLPNLNDSNCPPPHQQTKQFSRKEKYHMV